MPAVIRVPLPRNAYDVTIAAGALARLGAELRDRANLANRRLLLVSNPTVFEPYGERAIAALAEAGYEVTPCLLPDGEQYKTPETLQKIYDAALDARLERGSAMVALGGGVVGDMTGFAAATWLRGIAVVQVPTTLLAMVDAAIGGKTGVNHPRGKNLIGAFHQPKLVLEDPEVLATLPVRELRAGMAEVLKYGVIWDAELFDRLEAAPALDTYEALRPLLDEILTRSCQAKADVVSQDEREAGLRAILNYGHTVAHALESLTGYRTLVHGEAVAVGMVAAGNLAAALGRWTAAEADRQLAAIAKMHLPTCLPPGLDVGAIADALLLDKKVKDGRVRFVLPTRIGAVEVTDAVPADALRATLERLQPAAV